MEIKLDEAQRLIDAYQTDKTKLDTQSLFLSRAEIESVLNSDCTGIRIYLGQQTYTDPTGDYNGVQLVAGRVTKDDPTGMNYLQKSSVPPCPKTCP